mmetsp:Transcript_3274/g.7755  ORF Transcript_3274/g.7755 Transcript_3274/m.7755 type:complete len:109 (+) Transcript_3274:1411-1737(+)
MEPFADSLSGVTWEARQSTSAAEDGREDWGEAAATEEAEEEQDDWKAASDSECKAEEEEEEDGEKTAVIVFSVAVCRAVDGEVGSEEVVEVMGEVVVIIIAKELAPLG